MPTAPTLVAATSSNVALAFGTTMTSASLSLQSGDIVVVLAVDEGVGSETINAPTTTFANGGITALQTHSATSNPAGGAWTFTVSTTASGTVTIGSNTGTTCNTNLVVLGYRGGVAPTVGRSAQQAGSGRTISYTASQADSAIAYVVGDWAAAAVQTLTPSTAHTNVAPGPTAFPVSAVVSGKYTYYDAVLDDQTLTTAQTYGIGGSGTGPFTIVLVEVQGTGGGAAAAPARRPATVTRVASFRASTY